MAQPHRVFVGTIGEGLFRSTDGGETFTRASEGMFVECDVRTVAVHPHDPRTLYIGTEDGLFRSTDGGDFWLAVPGLLEGRQIWSILLAPQAPERLLVGTRPGQVFGSTDGGQSWGELGVGIQPDCPRIKHSRVTSLAADPANAEVFWAGVEIDAVHRSQDGGRSWTCLGRGLSSRDIHALALVPGNGCQRRLVATTNNDVNISLDDGLSWQPLQLPRDLPWSYFRGLSAKADQPEALFLGHGNGPPGSAGLILRSTDGGQSWQQARMPGHANSTIWNFATHLADPELIYASSVSGQLYRSTDAGASWLKLPREFGEIRALAWTP
jgi:photosystem II stability/assembly factor-like uncharacterized protein